MEERIADEGFIVRQAVLQAEELLGALAQEAKSYEILCVAHAHIDMNWMWSWDETVSIVIDTFRTMLNLMNEYPDFTFSQSQASIYRIVEKHAPDMLAEIKERVREEVGGNGLPLGRSGQKHAQRRELIPSFAVYEALFVATVRS